jgi:two-component system sensor histidine kinase UhpB
VILIDGMSRDVPAARRPRLDEIQATAREGVDAVREIALGLRPPALDEFGLRAALVALVSALGERTGVTMRHRIDRHLPALDPEVELAIYRVAQEAITNVARHAAARRAELTLDHRDGTLSLSVRDDGRGIADADTQASTGIAGMRERALLAGGTLWIAALEGGGTEVRMEVPVP